MAIDDRVRRIKNVPGRKAEVGDVQWLATLVRAGLLRGSFMPPADLRELRLIARQRQKLVGQLAAEKNCLHKALADAGICLGVVVSDLYGQSVHAMVKAIIAGQARHEVLDELMLHVEEFEASIARVDARFLEGVRDEHNTLAL